MADQNVLSYFQTGTYDVGKEKKDAPLANINMYGEPRVDYVGMKGAKVLNDKDPYNKCSYDGTSY